MNVRQRVRGSRITLLASVPLLALVTLAAGCGTVTTPPSAGGAGVTNRPVSGTKGSPAPSGPAKPTPVPTTTGGTITPGIPSCSGWPTKARRGTLPASFVPVAVLRCVSAYQMIPGKGQWLTETMERADTGLAPLVTALHHPQGRRAPGVMCPDIAMIPPQIVLINGGGSMLIPRLPLSGCGLVQEQVLAALAALHWHPVSVRLLSQVQTQAEVTGCTASSTDPFVVNGSPRPSRGGAVYPARPASLRICVYSASSAKTTRFLRGTTVTGTAENTLLAGLSGARGTSVCTLPHSTFAVVSSGASTSASLVYVELGGCDRVVRYQTGNGGLMGMSTGQATPQAVSVIEDVTHPKPS